MKRFIVSLILLTLLHISQAQQRWNFRSQNYVGLLEGEDGSAFHLQTINGFQYATWFGGIGTGLDYYMFRTIPLFLSINKDVSPRNRTFFFSLDGGLNFAWLKEAQRTRWNDFISQDHIPGLFWGGGIGYKVGLKNNKDGILFNLGYNYKHVKEKREQPTFCINPPCPIITETYNYRLRRFSLKVGWQF